MKNFTYVLVAALLSTSAAFAQSSLAQQRSLTPRTAKSLTAKSNPAANMVARSMDRSNALVQKAPSKVALPDFPDEEPVTDAPEGTLYKNYVRKGFAFYNSWFGVMGSETTGAVGNYVEGPDGTLWLSNGVSKLTGSGYLRLDKESEGNYVAKTPQTIYSEEGYVYYATRLTLQETADGGLTYALDSVDVDEVDTDVPFTYKDGVLKQVNSDYDDTYGYPLELIGLTDADAAWYGYGDAAIEVSPCTETAAVLPSSATVSDYMFTSRDLDTDGTVSYSKAVVKCGKDGNDFYLQDPYHNDDKWVKGSVDGNKLSFLPQYLGVDESLNNHVWFLPTTYSDEYLADYDYYTTNSSVGSSLDFTLDEATETYVAADSTGFAINGQPDELYYFGVYNQPTLSPFTEVAAKPADPSFDEFMSYDEDYGYGGFAVNIPSSDADGNFLNPNKMYFNVFFDGDEPETFSPDDYEALTESMTNVPYNFSDSWDFYVSGELHTVYFYTDAECVGVQSFYTGGGETHCSNVVWYPEVPASIKNLNNSNANVKSETYYDLQGRRLNAPAHGINLKVTTYADGTKSTQKVLK